MKVELYGKPNLPLVVNITHIRVKRAGPFTTVRDLAQPHVADRRNCPGLDLRHMPLTMHLEPTG